MAFTKYVIVRQGGLYAIQPQAGGAAVVVTEDARTAQRELDAIHVQQASPNPSLPQPIPADLAGTSFVRPR